MTLGNVDLKVVTARLEIVATCLREMRALPTSSLEEFVADVPPRAGSRSTNPRPLVRERSIRTPVGPLLYSRIRRRFPISLR